MTRRLSERNLLPFPCPLSEQARAPRSRFSSRTLPARCLSGPLKGWRPGPRAQGSEWKMQRPTTVLEWSLESSSAKARGRKGGETGRTPRGPATYLWPSSWAMVKARLSPLSSASTHFLLALHTPPK